MKKGIHAIILASAFLLFAGCNNFLNESPADGSVSEASIRARGIWIVGGCNGSYASPVSQIDLFDPVTGIWYPSVTSLPVPVSFAAVGTGLYNGDRVLVVAGGFNAAGTPIDTVQRYDMDADAWLPNGPVLPAPRANAGGAMNNNCLYVIGGTAIIATATGTVTNTIYEYNVGSNAAIVQRGTIVAASAGMNREAVPYEDTVLYFGGRTPPATIATVNDGFFISTGGATAAVETTFPTSYRRVGNSVVIYKPVASGTKVLSLGGIQTIAATSSFLLNIGGSGTPLSTCYYLNYPFTSSWTATTNGLPIGLACGAAALYEDTVYYFGGVQLFAFGSCQAGVYSSSLTGLPALNWKSQEIMPVARYGHAAVRFQ